MGKFVPVEFAEKIGNSGVLGVLIQVNLTAIGLERYSQGRGSPSSRAARSFGFDGSDGDCRDESIKWDEGLIRDSSKSRSIGR